MAPVAAIGARTGSILFWLAMLAVGVCLLVLFAVVVKKWLRDEAPPGEGFTLSDLKRMHARGQISDEELDAARRGLIAHTRHRMDRQRESADEQSEPGDDRAR